MRLKKYRYESLPVGEGGLGGGGDGGLSTVISELLSLARSCRSLVGLISNYYYYIIIISNWCLEQREELPLMSRPKLLHNSSISNFKLSLSSGIVYISTSKRICAMTQTFGGAKILDLPQASSTLATKGMTAMSLPFS